MLQPYSVAQDFRLYRRLLCYVLPYKWVFGAALLGMLLVSAGDASFVALLQPIIDEGFVGRDGASVQWLLLFLLALGLMRAVGNFIDTYCMSWVARRVVQNLRQLMFERLIRAPVAYYDHNSSGALSARLIYHVDQVATASTSALRVLFRDGSKVIFILMWMFYASWKLSLVFVVIAPIAYLVFKLSSGKFRTISSRIQASVGGILHIAKEALQGQRVVKIFGAYDYQNRLFLDANNHNRQQVMKATSVSAITVSLVVFLSSIGVVGVIAIAWLQELSIGVFASYILAMTMITKSIRSLSKINLDIQGGLAAAQSVFTTIDLQQEPNDGDIVLEKVAGDVCFDKVWFAYEENDSEQNKKHKKRKVKSVKKPVLKNISIDIKAGSTVALVGVSGSGKSTIASLLLRFYSPHKGSITLDGIPLADLKLESLRKNTAIVTQEIQLFDDSIANNIAYGEGTATDSARLKRAAEAANVTEFARDLPRGLDTRIGEQGVRLSGGQRQRIAIARALYKDAPLLIMDEATSSLDSHSEQHIQTAIARLLQNRTSLIIAHRLSTIENADLILVLDGGRIVEQGKHDELLKRGGFYAKLLRGGDDEIVRDDGGNVAEKSA